MPLTASLLLAVALAALIAGVAWQAGALSRSGALAALLVGASAMAAGPAWGAYLVLWFTVTSALSRLGRARKARHVSGIVEKDGTRDAWQVLANGAVFGALALTVVFGALAPGRLFDAAASWMPVAAAAALAAAGADTWATEIGTWARDSAWSLRTGRRVAAGTSGAISWPGTLGLIAGAVVWALVARALGLVSASAWIAVAIGGVVGATVDTLLGAVWQARRRCPACGTGTEQRVHVCGHPTLADGGLPWLDNDLVNLATTVSGALVAALLTGAG